MVRQTRPLVCSYLQRSSFASKLPTAVKLSYFYKLLLHHPLHSLYCSQSPHSDPHPHSIGCGECEGCFYYGDCYPYDSTGFDVATCEENGGTNCSPPGIHCPPSLKHSAPIAHLPMLTSHYPPLSPLKPSPPMHPPMPSSSST